MIDNVILVGMPSSGKSTVGRELARVLGLRFVDLDRLIEAREGMLLQEIIDTINSQQDRSDASLSNWSLLWQGYMPEAGLWQYNGTGAALYLTAYKEG